jgi:hypothetical protein
VLTKEQIESLRGIADYRARCVPEIADVLNGPLAMSGCDTDTLAKAVMDHLVSKGWICSGPIVEQVQAKSEALRASLRASLDAARLEVERLTVACNEIRKSWLAAGSDAAHWTKRTEEEAQRASKAEAALAQLQEFTDKRHAQAHEMNTKLAAQLAAERAKVAALREALAEYGEHGGFCILSRWEAGYPTESGGYEMCYAGKWYETQPVDRTPACTCGLAEALASTDSPMQGET